MKTLDMRGKPCPIPVITAKNALAEPGTDAVTVIVDNIVAVQNLEKMAKGMDYQFAYTEDGNAQYTVQISAEGAAPPVAAATMPTVPDEPASARGVTVLITNDQMGTGSEDLGRILIKGFLFSLTELSPAPEAVIFLNAGVRLACEGANTLDDLRTLLGEGTKVRACGTCLNFYQLTEQLAAGEITDMMGITQLLASAGRLITL